MTATPQDLNGDLLDYLRLLAHGPSPGQFLEVRWAPVAKPMRRRFIPAGAIERTARLIERVAPSADVYVGVALRDSDRHGGKRAISRSRLLYIECDDPGVRERLAAFPHPPTMEIASGTPGHLQLYWALHDAALSPQVERANERLARRLGGDPACFDIARILRPPKTLNHKHHPPQPVALTVHRSHAQYNLAQLTQGLPKSHRNEPLASATPARDRHARSQRELRLLAIPAADYVHVLTGRTPNRAGKILCPLHSEREPSLQIYADGTFYCFGSTCRKGGTIFDFAAHLWLTSQSRDVPLRGRRFIEVRERLWAIFVGEDTNA